MVTRPPYLTKRLRTSIALRVTASCFDDGLVPVRLCVMRSGIRVRRRPWLVRYRVQFETSEYY